MSRSRLEDYDRPRGSIAKPASSIAILYSFSYENVTSVLGESYGATADRLGKALQPRLLSDVDSTPGAESGSGAEGRYMRLLTVETFMGDRRTFESVALTRKGKVPLVRIRFTRRAA